MARISQEKIQKIQNLINSGLSDLEICKLKNLNVKRRAVFRIRQEMTVDTMDLDSPHGSESENAAEGVAMDATDNFSDFQDENLFSFDFGIDMDTSHTENQFNGHLISDELRAALPPLNVSTPLESIEATNDSSNSDSEKDSAVHSTIACRKVIVSSSNSSNSVEEAMSDTDRSETSFSKDGIYFMPDSDTQSDVDSSVSSLSSTSQSSNTSGFSELDAYDDIYIFPSVNVKKSKCLQNGMDMNLTDFAAAVNNSNDDIGKARMLLNGISSNGSKIRVTTDEYRDVDLERQPTVVYDVDSVLFSSDIIPATSDLSVYCFPNINNALQIDNHLTWTVDGEDVPLSTIPNFHFGRLGSNAHYHIHCFFPRMREKFKGGWKHMISSKILSQWYDQVFSDAVLFSLPPDLAKEFPISFENAGYLARTTNGHYRFTGTMLPWNYLSTMRNTVENCHTLEHFRDFFFHYHAKNLKIVLRSTVDNVMKKLFKDYFPFDCQLLDISQVYVDIGMEVVPFAPDKRTLVWDTAFCRGYLKALGFTNITVHKFCHFNDIGGATGSQMKKTSLNDAIVYCQMYLCEKNVMYSYANKQSTRISMMDVLVGDEKFNLFCSKLTRFWQHCRFKSFGVRCEWRVRVSHAKQVIVDIETSGLQYFFRKKSIIKLPSNDIFLYKVLWLNICKCEMDFWREDDMCPQRQKEFFATYIHYVLIGLISSPHPILARIVIKLLKVTEHVEKYNLPASTVIDLENCRLDIDIEEEIYKEATKRKKLTSNMAVRKTKLEKIQDKMENLTVDNLDAEDIFQLMLEEVWANIPTPTTSFKKPLPSPAPMFTREIIERHVHSPSFKQGRNFTWEQRFKWYFPDCPTDIPTRHGWSKLKYMDVFFEWKTIASSEDMNNLFGLFMQMDALPAGTMGTDLWKTFKLPFKKLILFTEK